MKTRIAMRRGRETLQANFRPLLMLAALIIAAAPSWAANHYPNRPIRIVVPTTAGSAQDTVVRLLQPYLERSLRQPIVVDNRSGASTMIGTEVVARAAPDGYTLTIVPTTFTVNAALLAKLPYDIERDFEPIIILVKNPLLFSINAKVPARTLTEFVALAKTEPGKFNYGTPGASTQSHLLIEMWSARAGIRMQHIPYRGVQTSLSVATGETHLVLLSPISVRNHIESGTVRPLATGGLVRDPQFPHLPTAAESGFPGFEAVQWLGLLATGRTPRDIVRKINVEVNRVLRDPELAAKLVAQGTTAAGGTPEEFRELIATEIRHWKETARQVNLEVK